jgi:hypothetical protein
MPPKKVALIFADSHLAQGAWVSREPIKGDSYFGFEQIIELALEHKVPLIGAGDLIDTKRPDPRTIDVLRVGCQKLKDAEIPFHYIMGQHDLTDPPWFSAVHDWPQLIEPDTSFMSGSVAFGGFSWLPSDQVNGQLAKMINVDVLILHEVWEEFMGGGQIICDGSLVHTPESVKAVFTGDYHRHMKKQVTGVKGNSFPVYSPGSTCLQSIDEPREKSVYLLYADMSVRPLPLLCRPAMTITTPIVSEAGLDEFCDTIKRRADTIKHDAMNDKVPSHLCEPLIYVEYAPDVTNIVTRLRKAVPSVAHLFMKPVFRESEERTARKVTRAKVLNSGLDGAVASLTVDDAGLRGMCQQLLLADNPVIELQALKETFFKKGA